MYLFFQLHSESVTHIISENNSGDEVRTWLGERGQLPSRPPVHLLDISWYTESMRESLPVTILDRHRLQVKLCQDTNQSMVPIRLGLVLWYSFVPGCIVKKITLIVVWFVIVVGYLYCLCMHMLVMLLLSIFHFRTSINIYYIIILNIYNNIQ